MAEAIGLAASIIQIAGAGAALSKTLYNYVGSAVCADQQIADIAGDVEITANALDSVGEVFQNENSSSIVSKKAINDANNLIKRCQSVFADIHGVIDKRRKPTKEVKMSLSTFGKLSWPLKEQKIQLLRSRLESLKNSLILLFHVLQLANVQAKDGLEKTSLEKEREVIRLLHERQQESLKALYALESKLDRTSLDDQATLCGQDPGIITQLPTINMMLNPTMPELENQKDDESSADESGMSESDGTISDNETDHLTLEDLTKCTKHVQKLLRQISALQRSMNSSGVASHPRRRGVRKIYRRFCRKFESNLIPNGDSNPKTPHSSKKSLPLFSSNPSIISFDHCSVGVPIKEISRQSAYQVLPSEHGIAFPQHGRDERLERHTTYGVWHEPLADQKDTLEASSKRDSDSMEFKLNPIIAQSTSPSRPDFAFESYDNPKTPIPVIRRKETNVQRHAQQMFTQNLQLLEDEGPQSRNDFEVTHGGFPPSSQENVGQTEGEPSMFDMGDTHDVLESFDFDSFLHEPFEDQSSFGQQGSIPIAPIRPKHYSFAVPHLATAPSNQVSGGEASGVQGQQSHFRIDHSQETSTIPRLMGLPPNIAEATKLATDYTVNVLRPEAARRQKEAIERGLPIPTEEQVRAELLRDYQMSLLVLNCGGDQSKRKRMYRISDYDASGIKVQTQPTAIDEAPPPKVVTNESQTFEYDAPVDMPPLFINPKQFDRIVKRRMERHALEQRLEAAEESLNVQNPTHGDSDEGEIKEEEKEEENEEAEEPNHENKTAHQHIANITTTTGTKNTADSIRPTGTDKIYKHLDASDSVKRHLASYPSVASKEEKSTFDSRDPRTVMETQNYPRSSSSTSSHTVEADSSYEPSKSTSGNTIYDKPSIEMLPDAKDRTVQRNMTEYSPDTAGTALGAPQAQKIVRKHEDVDDEEDGFRKRHRPTGDLGEVCADGERDIVDVLLEQWTIMGNFTHSF